MATAPVSCARSAPRQPPETGPRARPATRRKATRPTRMSAPVHQMRSSSRRKVQTVRLRKRASRARQEPLQSGKMTRRAAPSLKGDPYACRRCPDAKMNADCTACAEGYTLVGDSTMGPQSCIKTLHVTEAEEAFGLLSRGDFSQSTQLADRRAPPSKQERGLRRRYGRFNRRRRHAALVSQCIRDAYIMTALLQQIGPANPWPICVSWPVTDWNIQPARPSGTTRRA